MVPDALLNDDDGGDSRERIAQAVYRTIRGSRRTERQHSPSGIFPGGHERAHGRGNACPLHCFTRETNGQDRFSAPANKFEDALGRAVAPPAVAHEGGLAHLSHTAQTPNGAV